MLFTEFDQEKYDQAMKEDGKIEYAMQLIKRGNLTLEEAAKDLGVSKQEMEEIMRYWSLF